MDKCTIKVRGKACGEEATIYYYINGVKYPICEKHWNQHANDDHKFDIRTAKKTGKCIEYED